MWSGIFLPRVFRGLCRLRSRDVLPWQHDAGGRVQCSWLLVSLRQPSGQRDSLRCGALRHGSGRADVPLERVCRELHLHHGGVLPSGGCHRQRCCVPDWVLVQRWIA
jgi:hypothetical protein